MHPVIYRRFEALLSQFPITGDVLEIGPSADPQRSLLSILRERGHEGALVGLDRVPREANDVYEVVVGDSHDLGDFQEHRFGAVISNATLEHDEAFWRSVAEISRVLAPGGLLFLGVPGFPTRSLADRWLAPLWRARSLAQATRKPPETRDRSLKERLIGSSLYSTTTTYRYHAAPGVGDYWRFSAQAVSEILLRQFDILSVEEVHRPVRILAVGRAQK